MAQIRRADKRTGTVYVCETEAKWDPERKRTRYGKRADDVSTMAYYTVCEASPPMSRLPRWLRKRMSETGLDDDYTLRGLLDEVEAIERHSQEGRRPLIGCVRIVSIGARRARLKALGER